MNLPVSVKAALRCGDSWILLRNERDEWELPGGRIDAVDGSLQDTVRRECREELGLQVTVGALLDSWLFEVIPGKRVLIVCFAATAEPEDDLVVSAEHTAARAFAFGELDSLVLPSGYRHAIDLARALR